MIGKIENSIEELNQKETYYWLNKISLIENFIYNEYTFKNKGDNKKSKKIKERKDFNIFEFAPKEILQNENLILMALDKNFISYSTIDETLKENKLFNLRYLKENKYSYFFNIKEDFFYEEEIMDICVKKDPRTYTVIYYNRELYKKYGTKEKSLYFLDLNSKVYEFFLGENKTDLDIAKKALDLDLDNVIYMKKNISSKIFKSKELAQKLLSKNLDYFIKVNNKLRDDEEFLTPLIKKRPTLIEFASERLKEKKDFVYKAVGAYNFIDVIPEIFKKDPEMMEQHLENWIGSRWQIKKYQNIKPLLVNIIKKYSNVYKSLTKEEKLDEDYIFAVLHHNTFYTGVYLEGEQNILKILPPELKSELMFECVNTYPNISFDNELENETLSFARKKYTNIYLTKNLIENEVEKSKKFKI